MAGVSHGRGGAVPADPIVTLLTINKTAAAVNGTGSVGDTIDYSITVVNAGQTEIANLVITDPKIPTLTPAGPFALDQGEQQTVTGSYTITAGDVSAGEVVNTATATATSNGQPVGPFTSGPVRTTGLGPPPAPDVTLAKTFVVNGAGGEGDTITYTVTATNNGTGPATGVVVNDPNVALTPAGPQDIPAAGSLSYTGTYTITQADVDAGQVSNSVSATVPGQTPNPTAGPVVVTPPDLEAANGQISAGKTAVVGGAGGVGDTITYTVTVTNTGNVTMSGITVSDPLVGALTPAPPATLAPGAIYTATGTYVITQADINGGGVVSNTVTASGNDPQGNPRTATAGPIVTNVTAPVSDLQLTKAAVSNGAGNVGDTITYTITATNGGTVPLTGVTITDPSVTLTPAGPFTLAPAGIQAVTGTYTLTQADLDAGQVQNTATAQGQDPGGNPVGPQTAGPIATSTAAPNPSMSVAKTGSIAAPGGVGDQVSYVIDIANNGNQTLQAIAPTDPALGALTLDAAASTGTPGSLGVGQTLRYTGSRAITLADITAGTVDNTVTVAFQDPAGVAQAPVTASEALTAADGLQPPDTDAPNLTCPPDQVAIIGEAMTPVVVTSSEPVTWQLDFAPAGVAITAQTPTSVTIGGTPTAAANTTIELIGTDAQGNNGICEIGFIAEAVPSITGGCPAAFTTWVQGVPITPFTLAADATGGTWSVLASLPPGGPSFPVSQLPSGVTLNPATGLVSGTPTGVQTGATATAIVYTTANGTQSTDTCLFTWNALGAPSIQISKDIDIGVSGPPPYAPGDTITYNIGLSNDGGTQLTNLVVTDPGSVVVGSPLATLNAASADLLAMTATHTVTVAEATDPSGLFSNTATVVAQSPVGGGPVTDTATATAAVVGNAALTVTKTATEARIPLAITDLEVSNDSGATWAPLTLGAALAQIVGPPGTQRFRWNAVVPTGVNAGNPAVLRANITGDLHDGGTGDVGELFINGASVGDFGNPGFATLDTATSYAPGSVLACEWWHGQANVGGASRLDSIDIDALVAVTSPLYPDTIVSYDIEAANNGDLDVTGVTITDPRATVTNGGPNDIPVGGSFTANAETVVTEADALAGQLANTGTASGTAASGPVTGTGAETVTAVVPTASVALTKTVAASTPIDIDEIATPIGSGTSVPASGGVISYAPADGVNVSQIDVVLTNNSAGPLSPVLTIVDNDTTTTIAALNPSAPIAAGATVVVSYPANVDLPVPATGYRLELDNAADLDFYVDNAGLGRPDLGYYLGASAVSPDPEIRISGTFLNNSQPFAEGSTLVYVLTATNDGAQDLGNVVITDPLGAVIDGVAPVLTPGAQQVATVTHTVTPAEAAAGVINNTATVNSTATVGPDTPTDTASLATQVAVPPTITNCPAAPLAPAGGTVITMTADRAVTWSWDDNPNSGLSLNTATGAISGTLNAVADGRTVRVTATDTATGLTDICDIVMTLPAPELTLTNLRITEAQNPTEWDSRTLFDGALVPHTVASPTFTAPFDMILTQVQLFTLLTINGVSTRFLEVRDGVGNTGTLLGTSTNTQATNGPNQKGLKTWSFAGVALTAGQTVTFRANGISSILNWYADPGNAVPEFGMTSGGGEFEGRVSGFEIDTAGPFNGPYGPGIRLGYAVDIENTGSEPVSSVAVSLAGGETFTDAPASLTQGQTITANVLHTVTAAEGTAGTIASTAEATATGDVSSTAGGPFNSNTVSTPAVPGPTITNCPAGQTVAAANGTTYTAAAPLLDLDASEAGSWGLLSGPLGYTVNGDGQIVGTQFGTGTSATVVEFTSAVTGLTVTCSFAINVTT